MFNSHFYTAVIFIRLMYLWAGWWRCFDPLALRSLNAIIDGAILPHLIRILRNFNRIESVWSHVC